MTDTEQFSLGNVAWGFPADNLRHAKAETVQPTPTEQLRNLTNKQKIAVDALRTGSSPHVNPVGFFERECLATDFPAIIAHVKALEAERDELRANPSGESDDYEGIDGLTDEEIDREVNYQLGFAQRRVEILTDELAAMRLRADRAEHFVRIIAGLRPGNIGESEAGQLVRTAQATLQPITAKGTV